MGDCDVEVCFHESAVRIARKAHRCTECNVLIASGIKYHYKVGAIRQGYARPQLWQAKICQSCEQDWDVLTDAEFREGAGVGGCMCYGELRWRIGAAYEDGYLAQDSEFEMYLRWFQPDPEEVGLESRRGPGGVHPSEVWRLRNLFPEPATYIEQAPI